MALQDIENHPLIMQGTSFLQAWEKERLLESKSFANPILVWLDYCLYEITSHKIINFFAKKWSPTLKRWSQKQSKKKKKNFLLLSNLIFTTATSIPYHMHMKP